MKIVVRMSKACEARVERRIAKGCCVLTCNVVFDILSTLSIRHLALESEKQDPNDKQPSKNRPASASCCAAHPSTAEQCRNTP